MTDGNPAAIDPLKKASLSAGFFMLRMAGARRPGLKSPFYQRRFKLCDAGIERGPGQARFMRIKPDPALPKMMPALSPEAGVLHEKRLEGVIGKTRGPASRATSDRCPPARSDGWRVRGGLPPGGLHARIDGAADAFRVLFAFLTEDRKRGMIRDSIVSSN